ncbi:response regulator [candidate division GN15 bacterium]|nr:response regulator [candidate division GN15 bacterium]
MSKLRPQVLVVDDEVYICKIVVESLSSENYDVVSFTDPAKAIAHIREHPIDLVLTDLVIGEFNGVQVLEATRAEHNDAVVILMTAHPTIQTAISVLRKGAYDFLVKPFKLDALKAAIRRGLSHQKIQRDNVALKSQVEFLKVANAFGSGIPVDKHLQMVLSSCKAELNASATSIVEIEPKSGEIVRKLHDCDDPSMVEVVLDETLLLQFTCSRSTKPVVRSEHVTVDGSPKIRVLISQPILIRKQLHGVINLLVESRFDRIRPGEMDVLSILTSSAASIIANNILYEDVQQSYMQAIRALAAAIEARDACTAGHTDRVSRLAIVIAEALGWEESRIDDLRVGCMLHDIGKIGVPDSILNKADKLTEEELETMISHPMVGLKIIHGIDLLRPAIPYISAHHERYDGNGYPRGLAGDEIPIEGRLLAVADTFDAILSDRPYRKGAPLKVAVDELIKHRGTQFDPELVDVFIGLLKAGKVDLNDLYGRDEDLSFLDELDPEPATRVSETESV